MQTEIIGETEEEKLQKNLINRDIVLIHSIDMKKNRVDKLVKLIENITNKSIKVICCCPTSKPTCSSIRNCKPGTIFFIVVKYMAHSIADPIEHAARDVLNSIVIIHRTSVNHDEVFNVLEKSTKFKE